ncbi:MAG: 16S rRNA (guanine(527)-N(7))-methyltransferase RsmG [Lachnospiraceae bacterium]|nr:16S rRNA (guanine(527)-N(7))-methyltransferase RsmG [Lachnospiraceae bacterium]
MDDKRYRDIISSLEYLGLECPDRVAGLMVQYYDSLIETNRAMNLTRITEWREAVIKHFTDSLSLMKYYSFSAGSRVLDLGTGAGFPGVPLAICFPSVQFLLMDSVAKKLRFIEETCSELKIENVAVIHGRAEELGRNNNYREKFDTVLSRAVGELSILTEFCLPFVKNGGVFTAYKSETVNNEIPEAGNAIKLLGGEIRETPSFSLTESGPKRTLVIIKKVRTTPGKYPRKPGIPAKNPL